eukprot:s2554_g6.t1
MFHRALRRSRCQNYLTANGEVRVAWETEELFEYLADEDLVDDYETGVSTGVKKAVKKVLQGQDIPADLMTEQLLDREDDSDVSMLSSSNSTDTSGPEIKEFKVMELFSPKRVTAEILRQRAAGEMKHLTVSDPPNYDLDDGWDFFCARDRHKFWADLRREDPDLVLMTPECRGFSTLMNVNWNRMSAEDRQRLQCAAMAMFQFTIQVAEHRIKRDKFFVLEQPDGASSWNTHAARWLARQRDVLHLAFDQCMAGLRVVPEGLSKKRTAFMLNHMGIAQVISKLQCNKSHEHVVLDHGLPHRAQVWPEGLVKSVIEGLTQQMLWTGVAMKINPEEDEIAEEMEGELPDEAQDPASRVDDARPLSRDQRDMVKRLHINMGHLPKDRMLVMLKAAKAQPKVIRYVRDEMHCEECMRQRREVRRRPAAYPRTFEFNRIAGADIFYIKWNGKKIPFLNVVDHGSNWQTTCMVRPTSRGRFERGLEQLRILQSPWQNGRVERHGQWLKDRIELEVESGSSLVESLEDLEELAIQLVSTKNNWFSRGGFSPAQVVYGRNPRIPTELMSDATTCSPGWSDVLCDPAELDTAAFEFRKAHNIREKAKQLAMEMTSRERVRDAGQPPLHRHRTWTSGQWVLVWRTARGGERSRWVGPGLVILQNGHTVYVAMRSRLWKCNSDQLRPASSTEELAMQVVTSEQYRDLMSQMRSQRTGAVDVAREGPPPPQAWRTTMSNSEEGATVIPAERGEGALHPADREVSQDARGDPPEAQGTGAGAGHLLRPLPGGGLSSNAAPALARQQVQTHRESRRGSLETVSEPLSEPPGGSLSARSEDSEAKRRRLGELQAIQEDGDGPDESGEGHSREAAASIEALPPSETRESASVSERIQEIEERPHMRRRSRSPLPEVLLRQRRFARDVREERDPGHFEGVNCVDELKSENMEEFKAASIFFNQHSSEQNPEEVLWNNLFLLAHAEGECEDLYAGEPARNGEVTWSQMSPEEIQSFREADLKEWESLEKEFKAVKVWRGAEAEKLRTQFAHRIMSSRMVRRRKPMPGVNQYKAKSRFCVHGHRDPDSGTFRTFAPTPSTEALNLVCQVAVNEGMALSFADVKAAFAQSNKLVRPRGRIFVSPCEGTPLDHGSDLIELIAPIYGLDDAPVRWHETITDYLKEMNMRKSLLDPCVYVKHDDEGNLLAIILIEVDDFLICTKTEEIRKEIQQKLERRFRFGKWEKGSTEFIGRKIQQLEGEIKLSQEKYILEKVEAVKLAKGRRSNKEAELNEEEFKDFRSKLYRVSWVAHQTRPEASGTVSILSSRLHKATVGDAVLLNKMVGHLRSTASQGIRLRAFDSKRMTFVGISDAGGVDGDSRGRDDTGLPEDPVQGAWMVLGSDLLPSNDRKIPISVLSWRSSKLKRRVTSTMASETMALSQCLGEIEWLQIFYRDLLFGDVITNDWRKSLSPFLVYLPEECQLAGRQEQCNVTDAKSLYDALAKQCPSSRQDRRTALELAVIVDLLIKTGSHIRWTPHQRMPVDSMTKADLMKGNGTLLHLLKFATLKIDDEEKELCRRQRETSARSRTRRSSERLLEEDDEAQAYFLAALSNGVANPVRWFPQMLEGAHPRLTNLQPESVILVDDERQNLQHASKTALRYCKVARYDEVYRSCGPLNQLGGIGAHSLEDFEVLQRFAQTPWLFQEPLFPQEGVSSEDDVSSAAPWNASRLPGSRSEEWDKLPRRRDGVPRSLSSPSLRPQPLSPPMSRSQSFCLSDGMSPRATNPETEEDFTTEMCLIGMDESDE